MSTWSLCGSWGSVRCGLKGSRRALHGVVVIPKRFPDEIVRRGGTLSQYSRRPEVAGVDSSLAASVRVAEGIARSSRNRSVKEVVLDSATTRCAENFKVALADHGSIDGHDGLLLLVRATDAFSRMRILHNSIFRSLETVQSSAWQGLPASVRAEFIVALAKLQVEHGEFFSRSIPAVDLDCISQLTSQRLADLVSATASLSIRDIDGFGERLVSIATRPELDMRQMCWSSVGKLAWGLARMARGEDARIQRWYSRATTAVTCMPPKAGSHVGQLMRAFVHIGHSQSAHALFERFQSIPLGKDAYAALLCDADALKQASVLEHMATHCAIPLLKAMILNAAVIRCFEGGSEVTARRIMADMARQGLWNVVTYSLAERLVDTNPPMEGKPPYPGLLDTGGKAHKYVRAAYHAMKRANRGDADALLAGLEDYSSRLGWLKFGCANEKGDVINDEVRRLLHDGLPCHVLEFGTFLGYATLRMVRTLGTDRARVVTMESDPEVACLALNLLEHACVSSVVDVCFGDCEVLVPRLAQRLGSGWASFVYMDHNQMMYHADLSRLESAGLLCVGARLVATQCLKPGAPLLLWWLSEAERAGRCHLDIVSAPDCGCPAMEDWVVVADFVQGDSGGSEVVVPRAPATELALLAAECGLMRMRTAHGLVNESCWNSFVQHVRRSMETFGIHSKRDVWPDPRVRVSSRRLQHERMDY